VHAPPAFALEPNSGLFDPFLPPPLSLVCTDDTRRGVDAGANFERNGLNMGFTHLAAAVLAMQHFNDRNARVVPELAALTEGCTVQFDLQASRVFDTESSTHRASRDFLATRQIPCAMAGGWTNLPAIDLSILAHSYKIPFAAHRAPNARVTETVSSPFTALVHPDIVAQTQVSLGYLRYVGRLDYIALLYSQTESVLAKRETWGTALDGFNMTWMSSGYKPRVGDSKTPGQPLYVNAYAEALQRVKDSGYRTVVILMDNIRSEVPSIADAVEELQMNTGDYLFFVYDMGDGPALRLPNANVTKLFAGSSTVIPTSNAFFQPKNDPFTNSWDEDLGDLIETINALNPIAPGEPGYANAENVLAARPTEYGATFMYEAVLALGLGACISQQSTNGTVAGADHLNGMHQVNFTGPNGRMKFRGDNDPLSRGAREYDSIDWAAWNVLPSILNEPGNAADEAVVVTDTFLHEAGAWNLVTPAIYRDGRTRPPDLLRYSASQNFLPVGVRFVGLFFMSFSICLSLVAAVWVFVRRDSRVVRASQPFFLFLICLGTAIESSSVFLISVDESYEWSLEGLSAACAALPWFFVTSHILVYGALATKLWRVHRVLQFSRREIKIRHVVAPMSALIVFALAILAIWTIVDPLQWERREINIDTGETFASCESEKAWVFLVPELILILIPVVMTGTMAWKTKDVDEMYTESWYIFIMCMLQLETALVACPVIIILRDVSRDGQFLLLASVLTGYPLSTLVFMFIPKMIADYKERHGIVSAPSKRGEQQGVRVTGVAGNGLPPPQNSLTSSLSHWSAPKEQGSATPSTGSSGLTNRTFETVASLRQQAALSQRDASRQGDGNSTTARATTRHSSNSDGGRLSVEPAIEEGIREDTHDPIEEDEAEVLESLQRHLRSVDVPN
jgi:hypothetical protein